MITVPGIAQFFTLIGRYGSVIGSQFAAFGGTVTFTATVESLLIAASTPPVTVLPEPVTAFLDADGDLATLEDGVPVKHVTLFPNDDPASNPSTGWNWTVSFNLTDSRGVKVKRAGFSINAPKGTTADLTQVSQVTPGTGTPITVGPPNMLSIGTVETVPGELVEDAAVAQLVLFGTLTRAALRARDGIYNVLDYGAVPDNATDSSPAINAALLAAHNDGGGTVVVPPGPFALLSSIGRTDDYLRHVALRGVSPRGVGWHNGNSPGSKAGSYLRAAANVPVITGLWESCELSWLAFDADMRGSSAISAHFSKTVLERTEAVGWTGSGVHLNDGTFTDDLGFLNRIIDNNISDTGSENGTGLKLEYRVTDSWVERNNIESYGVDIEINSGGPFRVLNNHLNGNRNPQHNILINGGVRELLVSGNILENSRQECLKYMAPGWLTDPERTSLAVTSNIVRQSVQDGGKPVFGLYGATGNAGFYALGATVTGNTIASDYGPTYVVEATNFKDISATGNYWRYGHNSGLAPVRAFNCTGVEVIGNHGDNAVTTI